MFFSTHYYNNANRIYSLKKKPVYFLCIGWIIRYYTSGKESMPKEIQSKRKVFFINKCSGKD